MIVGLTGGIGSGKTAVSQHLHDHYGIPVTDADVLARQVVEPGEPAYEAILRRFPQARNEDGTLNRPWLREHVLPDNESRQWLESITHPAIRHAIRKQLKDNQSKAPYQLLDSPLLLETSQDKLCDYVVVVDATEEQQIERTAQRDDTPESLVRKIMAKQWTRAQRLQAAHHVVDNTGTADELIDATDALHHQLLEHAREHGHL